MEWTFRADQPIYSQLVRRITRDILRGVLSPGQKLPAVRELAARAGVNPNTMQRAMAELEQGGLIRSQRTAGRFVTDDENVIGEARSAMAREEIGGFFAAMESLGYDRAQTLQLLQEEEGS